MFIDKFAEPIKRFFTKYDEIIQKDKSIVELPNINQPEMIDVDENLVSWNYNYDVVFNNLKELIRNYRELSINYEVELGINEIVNEAVVYNKENNVVNINLDKTNYSENIKKKFKDEFDHLLNLLDFNNIGDEHFKQWYIDGRIYYQDIVSFKNPKLGILKINKLSPFDINRYVDKETNKIFYIWKLDEDEKIKRNRIGGFYGKDDQGNKIWKVPEQLITFVPSGLKDPEEQIYFSYLHKSIKPFNQLKLIEDSAIIYRLTRAPERRVFYIDVGRLPKKKAEAYVQKLINKFKNKVSYDSNTGKINQSKKSMTLLEDFYIPRSSTQKGTEIDTLKNGSLIDKIDDILYFKKKFYKSLNVPPARIDSDNNPVVNLGQNGEITREELKFSKHINKLQNKYSYTFLDLLKKQVILKGIITIDEWDKNKQNINFIWETDSYFESLKENEILSGRVDLANELESYVGKYFSQNFIQKNVFKMTDDDIENQQKLIKEESKDGKYEDNEDE